MIWLSYLLTFNLPDEDYSRNASCALNYKFLIFLGFCVILCCVFTFRVPCCNVRNDFRIKTMFGSSVPSVVCRRTHVLFTLFVFVYVLWCPTHTVLCFYFVFLRLVYPMLSVSLDCPFVIAPSVFSNVYLDIYVFITITGSIHL